MADDQLSPALDDLRSQLQDVSRQAQKLVAATPLELVARRPEATSWSVAECIAHLNLSTDAYLPTLREALATGRREQLLSKGEPLRMELMARALAWWLEPPYRMKSKTPPAFVPGATDSEEVLPDFLNRQERLIELLREADGLAIDRLRIASPFAPGMRYSVYSAFRLIAVHQRRHLWQAQQVARRVR